MGYDMHWVTKPSDEAELIAAAQVEWNAALTARNAIPREERGELDTQRAKNLGLDWEDHSAWVGRSERYARAHDAVMAASSECYAAERSYFRLNVWGMSAVCRMMSAVGMLFTDEPYPPWPEEADFGLANDDAYAVKYPEDYPERRAQLTPEAVAQVEKYWAAHDQVLAFHGKEIPGIPEHKFSSNDGWHVVPAECEAAVRIYLAWRDENGEDTARDLTENLIGKQGFELWNRWVTWVGDAAKHGGFTVH